jgi:hypothetical protein
VQLDISSSAQFEQLARTVLSAHFSTSLAPRRVGNVPKTFDLVSNDLSIVGDAKYYTLVDGTMIPPAKFSAIAEYVWLLEKTGAKTKFLIFGNDRRVPIEWLSRYRMLAADVTFYFIDDTGKLEELS